MSIGDQEKLNVDLRGCKEFLDQWYETTLKLTHQAFDLIESNGISKNLRETYFAMDDDPEWPSELNVIRKPNWPLAAADAVSYQLVTRLLPAQSKDPSRFVFLKSSGQ